MLSNCIGRGSVTPFSLWGFAYVTGVVEFLSISEADSGVVVQILVNLLGGFR